jgi:2'-5' RNA ligase
MENYNEFLLRIGEFQLPDIDLGKNYFKGRPSLADKIGEDNKLRDFYGDTVVFELDEATKSIIGDMVDEIYSSAGACFSERLRTDTLHMTLHDLSNSPSYEAIKGEVAENQTKIEKITKNFGSSTIRMKSGFIFNMVNTSLVMGLVPANEDEYEKLMTLYGLVDEIKRAEYPLTPHITLGYYNVHGFENAAAKRLENIVGRLNRREQIEIVLDTKRLYYQKFTSMNSYKNVISLGEE